MPEQPPRFQFLRTIPGRLAILSGAVLAALLIAGQFVVLPPLVDVLRKVVTLALIVAGLWLVVIAIAQHRQQLVWRVRSKLIVSYVLLGLLPVILSIAFALLAGVVLYGNLAAYVFHEGFGDLADDVHQIAETSAGEIGRNPALTVAALARKYENLSTQYPMLSLAVVPAPGTTPAANGPARDPRPPVAIVAGAWRHSSPPASAPGWLARAPGGFRGVIVYSTPGTDDPHLVIRAAVATADRRRLVVADLPVDTEIVARLDDRTKVRMGDITVPRECGVSPPPAASTGGGNMLALFRRTVAFMDCTEWSSGTSSRVAISLSAPVGRLYSQMISGQSAQLAEGILLVVALIGVLLFVFQGAALVLSVAFARQITYAVHELFEGTERVRQGDFTHRIRIESRDQLGELADSFNRMSGSIEHLLHVQREKQRLDDELRIARDIQKSLLPVEPPRLPGMSVADLCEPAREVGGDYYDFFELGPSRLGVLVADVSGKGTSAALYMAELKGLMLALSHNEPSPRRLLIDVNRRLAAHLDNRSFITMTYAVIDLEARTLTCARAGHTPLIIVSGGRSHVVVPSGMVLGLRLPGASERFEELLEEHTRAIVPGDVVVLYTDGVTEAMDANGELFGDAALARVVEHYHHLDAAGIRERVLREVKAFVGDAEPHDDMTMIVLTFDPPERRAA